MTKSSKIQREAVLVGAAAVLMTFKIAASIFLFQAWRNRQAALGNIIGRDDETE
jgi:hypothetical protein